MQKLVVMCLVVAVLAGIGPAARAQGGPDGQTAYSLNLRTGPGVQYPAVITLRPRTGLFFEGRNADSSWLLARTDDGAYRGWVASLYLVFRDGFVAVNLPLSEEIVPDWQAPPPAPAAPAAAVTGARAPGTLTERVNVRRGPSTDAAILARIEAQTPVTVEARDESGAWVLIAGGGARGWVAAPYVALDGLMALPVSAESMTDPEPPALQRVRAAPVIAQATARAVEIFQRGLARGNHPDRFSKVGDCQVIPQFFLGPFDWGEYRLGSEYAALQTTITHFAGSFARESAAVWSGFNVYAVLDPTWSNPAYCLPGESPIACEYRVWQPSFVIISLEVWHGPTALYVDNLRQVLDFWISKDVVPILGTKADNQEGDWSINIAIAQLAWEYDIPLWNFLMAAQPLRDFGLTDGFHLSYAMNLFDDPHAMQNAWPWRNLTALQSLDAVWRGVGGG